MQKLARYEDMEDTKKNAEQRTNPLPILRNNEARRKFIEDYTKWPVWFEVPETNETYYRYNLPDGSSIVICEYKMWLEWKERYADENPDSLRTKLYLLKQAYHYLHDCETNESAVVEHLKNVQKGLSK